MQLTVCLPSNRNHEASRKSIESAIAFCQARNAMLILSDNSGDPRKRLAYEGVHPWLLWQDTTGTNPGENFLRTIAAASTPFIMPMGDDDVLELDAAATPVELSTLPASCIGVKPVFKIFTDDEGLSDISNFAVTAETPGQRVAEYTQKVTAGKQSYFNSVYYSIFRRAPFVALFQLFMDYHPTKAAYFDWAFVMAMLSQGKLPLDPSIIFHYNAGNWHSAKGARAIAGAYENADLPADYERYRVLLLYLDLFIFVINRHSQLERSLAIRTATTDLSPFIDQYAASVVAPDRQDSDKAKLLAQMILDEREGMAKFQIALLLAEDLIPGLKDKYIRFFNAALG
jgi:hypothetical protein